MTNTTRDSRYNWVYQELVKGSQDIVGAIAYVLYKKQKIAYIEKFREANGEYPEDHDLQEFHRATLLKESLDGFNERATLLVDEMLERALADRIRQAEEEIHAAMDEKLREIINILEQRIDSDGKLFSSKIDSISQSIQSGTLQSKLDSIISHLDAKKGFLGWLRDISANLSVNLITIAVIGLLITGYNAYNQMNAKTENTFLPKKQNGQASPAETKK